MRLLTEEQKHWVEVIGEFAKKEIEPIMLDWDKVVDPSKAIPFEAYDKAFKLGLNTFEIPKEYGGNKVTPLFLRERSQSLALPMWSIRDWYLSFISTPTR